MAVDLGWHDDRLEPCTIGELIGYLSVVYKIQVGTSVLQNGHLGCQIIITITVITYCSSSTRDVSVKGATAKFAPQNGYFELVRLNVYII